MRKVTIRLLGAAVATLALIASAYANSVSFTPGNSVQPNEQNILLNGTMGSTVTGHTITARTRDTHTPIEFMSVGTVLSGKGGQSDIEALSGLIHDITVSIATGTAFKDLIINPFKAARANNIVVNAFLTNGTEEPFHFDNSTNGNQFLTIVATGSALIDKVSITSSGGFQSLGQTRISGVGPAPPPVPEPSSLLLLGIGLLGFAPALRCKKLS